MILTSNTALSTASENVAEWHAAETDKAVKAEEKQRAEVE